MRVKSPIFDRHRPGVDLERTSDMSGSAQAGASSPFLYPVEDGGARIVEKGFKGGIVLNPSDRWVAYAEGESGRKEVIFRGTDGSALARVALPFRPVVVGSLSTAGKFSTVAWP